MERSNKKLILITILICILMLSGCNKIHFSIDKNSDQRIDNTNDDQKEDKIDEKKTDNQEKPIQTSPGDSTSPAPSAIQPNANTELMIYTINSEGEIKPATALIEQGTEITPQVIVDQVVESMADNSLTVGIQSVTTQDDAVIVNFYSDQPPLINVGAGIEASVLDAIAQSLIDNLDDYSKVIYRMDGKAYASDHIALKLDEVYLGDN